MSSNSVCTCRIGTNAQLWRDPECRIHRRAIPNSAADTEPEWRVRDMDGDQVRFDPDPSAHATPNSAAAERARFPGKCRGGFKSAPAMAQSGRTYPCPVCGRMVRVTAYGWYYHHKPKVGA